MPIVTFSEAFPRGRGGRRGRKPGRAEGGRGRGKEGPEASAGLPFLFKGHCRSYTFFNMACTQQFLPEMHCNWVAKSIVLIAGAQKGSEAFQGRGQSLLSGALAPAPQGTGVYAAESR